MHINQPVRQDVAISAKKAAGSAVALAGDSGSIQIDQQPSNASRFIKHGRLNYIGEHYLKFDDSLYWIKSDSDGTRTLR